MPVSGDHTDSAERIRREASKLEGPMQTVFLQALNVIKDDTTLDELALLLAAGNIQEALRTLDLAGELIANVFVEGVFSSAEATVAWISSTALLTPAVFNRLDNVVLQALQTSRLEIIRDFTATQRETILAALSEAAERGQNPRQTAQAFRDALGLTPDQHTAIRNYRTFLERGDREALRRELRDRRSDRLIERLTGAGEPIPPATIDRLVDHYRQRQLRFRAERIARTESLAAANIGSFEAYEQLLRNGNIDGDEIFRTWNTSVDGRERPSHLNLDGQTKGPGEVFQGFNGTLRHPHDPRAPASERVNCRCALETRLRSTQ